MGLSLPGSLLSLLLSEKSHPAPFSSLSSFPIFLLLLRRHFLLFLSRFSPSFPVAPPPSSSSSYGRINPAPGRVGWLHTRLGRGKPRVVGTTYESTQGLLSSTHDLPPMTFPHKPITPSSLTKSLPSLTQNLP